MTKIKVSYPSQISYDTEFDIHNVCRPSVWQIDKDIQEHMYQSFKP